MANINEKSEWSTIVQLEDGDILKGGEAGLANAQATSLANRTNFLKGKVDALGAASGEVGAFPYPPMFVQGFKVEYVSRTKIKIFPGKCRCANDQYNMAFSNENGITIDVTGYAISCGLFVHGILKEDDSVIFKVTNKAAYTLIAGEKATRRIGSLMWETTLGIRPFVSTLRNDGILYMLNDFVSDFKRTGAANPEVRGELSMTIPKGVSCLGKGHLFADNGTAGDSSSLSTLYYVDSNAIIIRSTTGSGISLRSVFDYNSPAKEALSNRMTWAAYCLGGKQYTMEVATIGYLDWRID